MKLISSFCKSEHGGGLVEYSLIVVLIALAAITAITTVGTNITSSFTTIADSL